jgi:cytochrome c oxidase assembly protein subunit 15
MLNPPHWVEVEARAAIRQILRTILRATGMTPLKNSLDESRDQRHIALWLLICCTLIFAMVVLGGITRLTGSGLSIVAWEPVSGIVPPLTDTAWEAEFTRYQTSPEYQQRNTHLDLEGFKTIYWFEYGHRLLGRTIGVVFLLPFLYFLLRNKVDRALVPKLALIFVLGALQGLLGWYMVKSGLVDDPHVSQYRLTAHLAAAAIIYAYALWVALDLLSPPPIATDPEERATLRRFSIIVTGVVFITMLSGGFVAGLKAGYAYSTFPKMGDEWIPSQLLVMQPAYLNFFENIATVQFNHRLLATTLLLCVSALWLMSLRQQLPLRTRLGMHLLFGSVVLQVGLGIATLLLHVPLILAAVHQVNAMIVLTLALYTNHELRVGLRPLPFAHTASPIS